MSHHRGSHPAGGDTHRSGRGHEAITEAATFDWHLAPEPAERRRKLLSRRRPRNPAGARSPAAAITVRLEVRVRRGRTDGKGHTWLTRRSRGRGTFAPEVVHRPAHGSQANSARCPRENQEWPQPVECRLVPLPLTPRSPCAPYSAAPSPRPCCCSVPARPTAGIRQRLTRRLHQRRTAIGAMILN